MPNPFGIPEIDPSAVAEKRQRGDDFVLVDVREAAELQRANLGAGVTHVPLSAVAQRYLDALPPELTDDKTAEVIVFCHHGSRSAQMAAYLKSQGWTNVLNMRGGIHAWSTEVDKSVPIY